MLLPFEIALRDALRKRADDKEAEKLRAAEERAKKVKRDSLGLPIDVEAASHAEPQH
ncbi:hypothetical protein [Cupriavidus numazuensis]|uniref:Uncharacterized protein n=1 Tax=Cupriavidus numazuensis TaxID=221992 RepID=A0ABN7PTY7_9BURK|nr:hypothetical protein [Cupriavidus numazuensis]CAG2132326.1 hypothetical protein LMG26411_00597 [Cupriavidus numazuensis]